MRFRLSTCGWAGLPVRLPFVGLLLEAGDQAAHHVAVLHGLGIRHVEARKRLDLEWKIS